MAGLGIAFDAQQREHLRSAGRAARALRDRRGRGSRSCSAPDTRPPARHATACRPPTSRPPDTGPPAARSSVPARGDGVGDARIGEPGLEAERVGPRVLAPPDPAPLADVEDPPDAGLSASSSRNRSQREAVHPDRRRPPGSDRSAVIVAGQATRRAALLDRAGGQARQARLARWVADDVHVSAA